MSRFVESIRLENGYVRHLFWHQRRLERTVTAFYSQREIPQLDTIKVPEQYRNGLYKIRVIYSDQIEEVEYVPYSVRTIRGIQTVRDDSVSYNFKYLDRRSIQSLRPEGLADETDILIVKNAFITDCSSSSVAFFDGSRWYVPHTPLLPGTSRDRLLAQGVVTQRSITVDDIPHYSHICIFNAMIDFGSLILGTDAIALQHAYQSRVSRG